MKKIIYLLAIALVLVSCKEEAPKDYVTLSGVITNQNTDSLMVRSGAYIKKINVNEEGKFSDTLKVASGYFSLHDGKERTYLYLKNGFDLQLTVNTKEFDETITYKGVGAEASNYMALNSLLKEQLLYDNTIYDLDRVSFDKKTNGVFNRMESFLENAKSLDSTFLVYQSEQIKNLTSYVVNKYEDKQYMATVLLKGKPSPKFVDYENYAGGKISLDDLKGKYVYMDIWATWCAPCKYEIPFLKEIEKAYHNKNIEFVSISVDKIKNYEAWRAMIKEKELRGIQLLADKDFESDFVKDYVIRGIPRFILIDPNGNIVSADAPRPSNKELKALFNELKI